MGGYRGLGLALLVGVSGCSMHAGLDLARNDEYYRSPGYKAVAKKRLSAYIAPLRDARTPPKLPKGAVAISYMPEGKWRRPVTVMVDEIVRRELAQSAIYASFTDDPAAADLILEPTLKEMLGAWETVPRGSRSSAAVTLGIKVLGPKDASGRRRVWLDKEFREVIASDFALQEAPNVPTMTGVALSRTVARLLHAVYEADGRATEATGDRDRATSRRNPRPSPGR